MVAFVLWELHGAEVPLLRLKIFRDRNFSVDNVALLLMSFVFVPYFFFASVYAQVSLAKTSSEAGVYLLYFFIGFVVLSQIGGRILDRRGARPAVVLGSAMATVGFYLLAKRLPDLSLHAQKWSILVAGGGIGLMLGPASTDAVNRAPSTNYSEVTGITQTVRNFGASLGLAILGTVLLHRDKAEVGKTLRARRRPGARRRTHRLARGLEQHRVLGRRELRRRPRDPARHRARDEHRLPGDGRGHGGVLRVDVPAVSARADAGGRRAPPRRGGHGRSAARLTGARPEARLSSWQQMPVGHRCCSTPPPSRPSSSWIGTLHEDGLVTLRYGLDHELFFEERFRLPVPHPLDAGERSRVEPLVALLHWVAGVSYFKLAAPPQVRFEGDPPGPATAALLEALYSEGLGEFAYTNRLARLPRPRFAAEHPARRMRLVEGVVRRRGGRSSPNGCSCPSGAARTLPWRSRSSAARACRARCSRSATLPRSRARWRPRACPG